VSGDNLTITGPLEGTADRDYAVGDWVDLRVTAGYVNDLNAAVNGILNPYQAPAFTAFAISGQATSIEVGTTITAGSKVFTWTTSNSGNVAPNTIGVTDTTTSTVLGTALPNTGSASLNINAVTNNAAASHTWTVTGTNTQSGTFNRTFVVSWLWRIHAGTSTSTTLNSAGIVALAFSALQSTVGGTYSLAAGGYKYFSIPVSFTQPASFKDQTTGFNVPMADTTSDPSYSNTNPSGINYAIVSVTSATGVVANYAVYRSYNQLGSSLKWVVA
jgi:hypothetical protein